MNKYEEILGKFDFKLNDRDIRDKVSELIEKKFQENHTQEVWKFLYSCIDLTSLNTADSKESVWKFIEKINTFDSSRSDMDNPAAVCVYPNFVSVVKESLTADVKIATVAGGFPSSQTFIEVKIAEASLAVTDGADEVDVVLNIGSFLDNDLEEASLEIQELKEVCKDPVLLKVILETGLLKTASLIKKASLLAIYSGADFIKTSTGKEPIGATLEAVYVMCKAIKEYNELNNNKIGIKIAGGVRTVEEAVKYYTIVKEVLGPEWLSSNYFRIGASQLSENILLKLEE